ncbi:MAG: hypothetical protein IT462_07115 [Planctomycetes bacterium]|nr:hypothetical protein [Planctomycetota bacterium]
MQARSKCMLSAEHRELLSAFADGELGRADSALAGNLLRRADAREYLQGLLSLRALIRKYARVDVPADFAAVVVAALAPAGQSPAAAVHQLPVRVLNLWLALAAALVVAAGLFIGSATFAPTPNAPVETLGRLRPVATEAKPPTVPPIAPPGPPREAPSLAPSPADPNANVAISPVLRLDTATIEVCLVVNRRSDAPSLQIFNDVLRVGALYGEAVLSTQDQDEHDYRSADAKDGSHITSSAFGNDCVEVEIDESKVAQFLESLGKLSAAQEYGRLSVPGYLKADVKKSAVIRAEVERLAHKGESGSRKAAEVLPLDAQFKAVARDTGPTDPNKIADDIRKLGGGGDYANGCLEDSGAEPRRKLIIRLR